MRQRQVHSPEVRPGSIWADNSIAGHGRSLLVVRIEHGYAICKVLTNSQELQRLLDLAAEGRNWGFNTRDMRGSITRIRLDRFRPTANGYSHVTDMPNVTDEALQALLGQGR